MCCAGLGQSMADCVTLTQTRTHTHTQHALTHTPPDITCCCLSFCDVLNKNTQVNTEIVAIQRVITDAGEAQLKTLIQQHADKTGSGKAAAILADWPAAKDKFWQIVPPGELLFGVCLCLCRQDCCFCFCLCVVCVLCVCVSSSLCCTHPTTC